MTSTTQPAAFQATYSDLRFVRTRKVVQVVLEAPIEHAAAITAALGYPDPAQETWVAVARLKVEAPAPSQPTEKHPDRRRFEDLPVGQQAAMRCREPRFRAWVRETFFDHTTTSLDAEDVPDWMHRVFRVSSRNDIPPKEWAALDNRYQAWLAKEAA